MKVKERLSEYYKRSPFGDDGGLSKKTAVVYAGPYFITVPNTPSRQELVPYHDLHHLITGYSNSRIGEAELGAWELGTGCWNKPTAVFLNVSAIATGILYSPRRIASAFLKGCNCRNLYDLDLTEILGSEYEEVMRYMHTPKKSPTPSLVQRLRLLPYLCLAAAITPVLVSVGYFPLPGKVHKARKA